MKNSIGKSVLLIAVGLIVGSAITLAATHKFNPSPKSSSAHSACERQYRKMLEAEHYFNEEEISFEEYWVVVAEYDSCVREQMFQIAD